MARCFSAYVYVTMPFDCINDFLVESSSFIDFRCKDTIHLCKWSCSFHNDRVIAHCNNRMEIDHSCILAFKHLSNCIRYCVNWPNAKLFLVFRHFQFFQIMQRCFLIFRISCNPLTI